MGEKTYTVTLTAKQIWHLRESFEASFTDPDSMNETERALSDKLDALQARAHKDRVTS